MSIFKRKIEYVPAICPKCKGNLQLDATLETAYCQSCGAQCIIENAKRKEKKQNKLETVLDFVERQQALRRQDKKERERKYEEDVRKHWWIYLAVLGGIIVFSILIAILANQGII